MWLLSSSTVAPHQQTCCRVGAALSRQPALHMSSSACLCVACRELPQLRVQIKQMEEEKERLSDKVQKAAAQAAGALKGCTGNL